MRKRRVRGLVEGTASKGRPPRQARSLPLRPSTLGGALQPPAPTQRQLLELCSKNIHLDSPSISFRRIWESCRNGSRGARGGERGESHGHSQQSPGLRAKLRRSQEASVTADELSRRARGAGGGGRGGLGASVFGASPIRHGGLRETHQAQGPQGLGVPYARLQSAQGSAGDGLGSRVPGRVAAR